MPTLPAEPPHVIAHHGPVVAVFKPSGMQVHPANDSADPDLCAWLAAQPDLPEGLTPIHRLDREASGLVLCAAAAPDRAMVAGWFERGEVRKVYLVLVFGHAHKKGIIRRPLQDARRRRPLEATTRFHLEEALGGFSLLRVEPETGRKHQIRRHLAGVGLPIVGDDEHRPGRYLRVPAYPGRLWLHAWKLVLPDATEFEAPLPPELIANLEALRVGASARG